MEASQKFPWYSFFISDPLLRRARADAHFAAIDCQPCNPEGGRTLQSSFSSVLTQVPSLWHEASSPGFFPNERAIGKAMS